MRDLIIMRGCPGSGKSTAIKEAGLENYVLSPDTLRLMLRAPEVTENFTYSISQQDNALVFELLDKMLVNRMKTGSPTIIDATHCSSSKFHTKQINRYRELAKQYKYRLFYWEPERESIQTYIDRNKYRDELNQVPENVIRKMYKKKTDFYLKWKFYRSLIERIIEGRALPELSEEDAKFIKWLNQTCPQGNIIEIRKQYEKYLTDNNN